MNAFAEEKYITDHNKATLPKKLIDFGIEVEQKVHDQSKDRFDLYNWLPSQVWFNVNRHKFFGAHDDGSSVQEFILPHSISERNLKTIFLNKAVHGTPWRWYVDKNPVSSNCSAGSTHVHFSVIGDFVEPRSIAAAKRNPWTHAPVAYYCVAMNSMLPILTMFPWWIFNNGRNRVEHWCRPVWKPATIGEVRGAFENNKWIHYDLNNCPISKDPSLHTDPYLSMQWNAKSYKATTLEIRLSEQHPMLLFGLLNGISGFLKTRIAQLSSFAFTNDVVRKLWYRWQDMHGESDAAYRILDTDIKMTLDPEHAGLQHNYRKNYRMHEWDSPLEFFKDFNLFMRYARMENECNAGEIFTLFAHGLQPAKVPSYLLWDIPLLYEYTFFHGGDSKWCYRGGILTAEEKEKYAPRLNIEAITQKKENDPHYMRWQF